MAATVVINEENTGSHTVTAAISKSDYGSSDAANLDPVANPVAQSSSSYIKWQQYHVTAIGGSSAIQNLKFYSTAPASGWTMFTNCNTTQATYTISVALFATPVTPVATDQSAGSLPTAMPTSAPGTANVGIGGLLPTSTGKITTGNATASATVCSDWIGSQLKCATPTAGGSLTNTYGYDEVA
jgi:hypothetical protein